MSFPYHYLRRETWNEDQLKQARWDVFLSAFNHSERVRRLWSSVSAGLKIFAMHTEYGIDAADVESELAVFADGRDEAEFVFDLLCTIERELKCPLADVSIAIDVTGFMRPELVVLVQALKLRGVRKFDLIYSEPVRYERKGRTVFSKGNVRQIRQVRSCEGAHTLGPAKELLILGVGYDHDAMALVVEEKRHAERRLLIGFPSLAPDMYQESILRVRLLATGQKELSDPQLLYSPANDPFHTAAEVSKCVNKVLSTGYENVYLSPLGTKLQVVGFALFYAIECRDQARPVSIILPFAEEYSTRTSDGIGRIWRCVVEFPSP